MAGASSQGPVGGVGYVRMSSVFMWACSDLVRPVGVHGTTDTCGAGLSLLRGSMSASGEAGSGEATPARQTSDPARLLRIHAAPQMSKLGRGTLGFRVPIRNEYGPQNALKSLFMGLGGPQSCTLVVWVQNIGCISIWII